MSNDLIERILARPNMQQAWEQVRANRGAPGIDQVTLARWGRNWETNVERLCDQVRTNTYLPNRPKRFVIYKKGGGERELVRLTVSDKVMQRAVLNIIEEPFDKRFVNCSHGYRPRRSVATAVQQVLAYRDQGLRWVLDADIAACFDSLDHELLMTRVRRAIQDWFVLNLMELWLQAGRKHRHQAVGVPMGGVLSPLWCNVYLHPLDTRLSDAGWKIIRFADDFIILVESQARAQEAWSFTTMVLKELRLQFSSHKTRIANFEEGFQFLGVTFLGDSYSYQYQQKRIEIADRKLRWLYNCPPDFY